MALYYEIAQNDVCDNVLLHEYLQSFSGKTLKKRSRDHWPRHEGAPGGPARGAPSEAHFYAIWLHQKISLGEFG